MRVALATLALALVVLAPAAGAKEGVWAELVTMPPAEALPGEQIHVSWTLQFLDHGTRKPFGAGGIFIRLLDAAHGTATTAVANGSNGLFEATVQVPAGGIGGLQIGIHGTTDVYFPVRNNPYTLHRELHLPTIALGAKCPLATVDESVDFSSYGVAKGIGPGPVFPIFGGVATTLRLAPPVNFGSKRWAGQKVLWLVMPSYTGPVLIRGGRLDGPGRIRFELGNVPPAELFIPAGSGARDRPSYTRLSAPGCYAYQIDGFGFSRTIVFRAVRG
jgi:hypothetical protein